MRFDSCQIQRVREKNTSSNENSNQLIIKSGVFSVKITVKSFGAVKLYHVCINK